MSEGPDRGAAPVLRTSSYTIYVDLPGNSEELLLVHGYSGACDKVSRRVGTYIRALESHPAPPPLFGDWSPEPPREGQVASPTEATLQRLVRRGYLTARSPAEEESYFARLVENVHRRSIHRMPGYVLMLTYECNLRCPYCFQGHMRTATDHQPPRTMQPEMVDRIFAAIPDLEAKHGIGEGMLQPRSFVFYGGEPLLESNRPIVSLIYQKAQALGPARFSAITNATELHAYEDLLGPEGISFLQVTLDGPPRQHDKRRIHPDGTGSFERIAGNIELALARGVKLSVRLNVDRSNIADLPELIDEFYRRGWTGMEGFSVYTAPVHASSDTTASPSMMGSWELQEHLGELHAIDPKNKILRGPDDGIEKRLRAIFFSQKANPLSSFKAEFCGANNTMYVLDAFGDIYACWERTGDRRLHIGYIDEAATARIDEPAMEVWRGRTVGSNPVCRRCRFAFQCGGGCAANAETHSGSLSNSFCDEFGKRFRAAAARAYLAHVTKPAEVASAEEPSCDV